MRRVGFVLGALVLLALALAPAFAAQPFSDVPQDHWAYSAIEKLASQGLIEGYPDGTFKGKRCMTRYEFAVALARIMDRVQQLQGQPGPQGPAGPAGPPGPSAGAGLTAEQQALLNRLATEFAPELQSLRADLNALTRRVEELEARPVATAPVINVSGNIGWRVATYGTKLGFEDVDTTGYPAFGGIMTGDRLGEGSAFGVITVPSVFGDFDIPISDSLKDSFKAGDSMAMRTYLNFSGNLSDKTSVMVSLLASPNTNISNPFVREFDSVSPSIFSGNGMMDMVQFDQMWLKTGTRFITPVDLTIGKQYLRRGVGLLFDNDQESLQGVRADFGNKLRVGAFLGMLQPEEFFGRTFDEPAGFDATGTALETNGQDNINLLYADFGLFGDWRVGGNWLQSGFNKEQGWSVSLTGPLYGLGVYGEYSKLTKWPTGEKFADFDGNGVQTADEVSLDESDTAWLAGLKWSNPWVALNGEYGQVDAGYAFNFTGGGWDAFFGPGIFNVPLSALHPRAEIDPYDINWIDRPLFLDPTNIAKGWHVQATFPALLGGRTPLTVSYATGDAYNPAYLGWLNDGGPGTGLTAPTKFRDADPVWWVKLSRQMSESVSANLLYGRRETENVMSPGTVPIANVGGADVFAPSDPIQVIRAEVSVKF